MIAVILAAGYATRLYPITKDFPKPLLKIGESSILDYLIQDLEKIETITRYVVISNHKFIQHFEKWKAESTYAKSINLVDDGSMANDDRLGAVKDLELAIQEHNLINEDLMVLAADNILNFSLKGFVDFFHEKGTSLIMAHHEPKTEALQKTGVVTLDEGRKVTGMEEKPKEPKSNWAVPPFYIYKKEDVNLIPTCIEEGCPTDAPGSLAKYLLIKTTLHAWEMTGSRTDIGTLDAYEEACKAVTSEG